MLERVKFEVISIEKTNKKDFVKVDVRFENSHKIYNYIRKENYNSKENNKSVVIDGCRVTFDNNSNYISTTREYNTAGVRKTDTSNISKGMTKEIENILKNIPKAKKEKPEVKIDLEKPVKHSKYEQIKACIENEIPVYLYGPAGSGKNHTLQQIAEELELEFYFTNSVQQEYKITGFIDAGGIYHETEFYKAFKNGGLFFLDEMDASIPEVLVLLNAAIANGYFEFPNGKIFANENFRVVAAGNTVGNGADEQYTGRLQLDQATLDRFATIEFDYDKNIELVLAKGNTDLVDFVRDLRKQAKDKGIRATFSYRSITMVTKLENKMELKEILLIAVLKGMDKDTINTFETWTNTKYHKELKQIQAGA